MRTIFVRVLPKRLGGGHSLHFQNWGYPRPYFLSQCGFRITLHSYVFADFISNFAGIHVDLIHGIDNPVSDYHIRDLSEMV